jgi:beta-galactosidase
MVSLEFPVVYFGGDYNPDQWPREIWHKDMELFKKAHVNILTLPVFSWALLQPAEDVYNFEWLDELLDMIHAQGIKVCLATATAAQPAWMSRKYPEILPVDFEGRKRKHSGRVNFCPNSPVFREFSGRLVRKMAERYKDHPALALWHVGNEYGTYCYCETCEKAFREWLKKRYGSIEELNRRWNMNFWGHTVYDWEDIVAPSGLSEVWRDGHLERTTFQPMVLDYKRFMSESSLACYKNEYDIIKGICPDIPVTTNLMGAFKPLDYFKWAEHMDIVSWDNYPGLKDSPGSIAFNHDLMRGLKGGQSFLLMEQTPNQTNWHPYNSLKRPGVMRLLSYQAMAHGADSVMYFQMRQSIGNCEKFHGALIEHAGHEHTRVFRECAQLGQELENLKGVIGARLKARAAILFDWENWWAVELSSGPTVQLSYVHQVKKYYEALFKRNITVDIIKPGDDLSPYALVIAPVLYMLKPGVAESLKDFVENGGTFLTTFMSGLVDENDRVTTLGYPGELKELLGIWVEEIDALEPGMCNSIRKTQAAEALSALTRERYACAMLCDVMEAQGAEVLAVYENDFYAGKPAVTRNAYGRGRAYYVGTDSEEDFIQELLEAICDECGIIPDFQVPQGVEITQRFKGDTCYTFVLNHLTEKVIVDLNNLTGKDLITGKTVAQRLELEPKGVAVLEEK